MLASWLIFWDSHFFFVHTHSKYDTIRTNKSVYAIMHYAVFTYALRESSSWMTDPHPGSLWTAKLAPPTLLTVNRGPDHFFSFEVM